MPRSYRLFCPVFILLLSAHAFFAMNVQSERALWLNVPPVPAEHTAALFALGDRQMAYRLTGTMLQNLGNTGGQSRYLGEYDYERLGAWFRVADFLDPRSNFVPLLAAYYFGATREGQDLGPVIDYLAEIGQRPGTEQWRWLGQAVFLARFRQGDLNKAMDLAQILASLWEEGRPAWMRQMPAFVMLADGDKKAAYDIMVEILREESDKMHPNEVNFMVDYICERLLTPTEAAQDVICASAP